MPEEDFDSIFDNSAYISRSEAQRLAREEVQKTLRDISVFNAQAVAGQQAAIKEAADRHPDFEQRRDKMLATLNELPLLRDAIGAAEANPQLAPTLPGLYEIAYRASQAPASNATASTASQPSGEPSDLSDESVQYRAALAAQRVDLSPENRKSLIAELEKRGVGDIEF